MKAELWKIYVCDGLMGMTHNMFYPIYEVYIPELTLAVNSTAFFVTDRERYAGDNQNQGYPNPEMLNEIELSPDVQTCLTALHVAATQRQEITESLFELFKNPIEVDSNTGVDLDGDFDNDAVIGDDGVLEW